MQAKVTLGEALSQFLSTVKEKERYQAQQDLSRFVNWCGAQQPCDALAPYTIENYLTSLGPGNPALGRLATVKGFLVFLKERGFTEAELATHVRAPRTRRAGANATGARRNGDGNGTVLTRDGYEQIQARLQALEAERLQVAQDIQRAAADKDFRENAPLQAARERAGFLEGQIAELREALRHATVMEHGVAVSEQRVRLGRKVTLRDKASGQRVRYTLVDTREANPLEGKISPASPIGRALVDRAVGEEVSIQVPRGTLSYVIEKIDA